MHLAVIGVNHKTAPLELREKLFLPEAQRPALLSTLQGNGSIRECAALSTCNRTEIYAYADRPEDERFIVDALGAACGIETVDYRAHLYAHSGAKAAEHLFRVASGLDSMVLGEAQILGQVRCAYAVAMENQSTGPALNMLFQRAIHVGKRARAETEIGRGAFSIGSVAAQLARSIFDGLENRTILVIGAGKMSELTINHLKSSGAGRVLVANRTHETAAELAAKFCGMPVHFNELPAALEAADVVIASTGADNPIISKPMVSDIMKHRKSRPIFFIDIAVPRDVEPGVADLEGVFAYDIDDLQGQVEVDVHCRETEVAKVEAIIKQEVAGFAERLRSNDSSDNLGIWNDFHSAAGHNRAADKRYGTAGELP